ncbi:hypothetical protein [Cytophaga aurantiaca]|uniref:hypothetical protein n=1 Tax=Cytophaga aurantiaca TaxID=29530 RepID=UPI000360FB93|nr:hypothetical protein [Cytophaga aurantiaca]
MNKLKLAITVVLLNTSLCVFAQTDGIIPPTVFTTEDKAKLDLVPANRFFEQNQDLQPQQDPKPQQYDTKDYSINPPRFDAKVKIPTMPVDSLAPILANYAKLGAGNYGTVLGEVYLTNKRSKSYSYGAHGKHLSSSKGSLMNSGNGHDLLEVFGSKYGKVNSWNGHVSYSNDRYRYYGLPQADSINNKDSIKQTYQLFHAGINTNKTVVGDKFTYNTGFDVYYLTTKRKANELELMWNGKGTYKINDIRSASLEASISNANRVDSSTTNRFLLMIKPTYKLIEEKWDLTVGATVNYSTDTLKGSNGFHLYPAIHGNYNLLPGKVTVFAGIGGGMNKNTYRTLVQQNPYLGSDVPLHQTSCKLDLYAGSSGNIDNNVSYKVQISYKTFGNQYFLTNSNSDSSQFTALYDNANLFSFDGGLFYDLHKDWRVSANVLYNAWKTDVQAEAWHRPAFQSSLGIQYNLQKKIYFNAEMYYISGIQGRNLESNRTVKLSDIADLSLKSEYRFSNTFSAFLELNNILSQKYQRYLYYQVKGFNVLAGLTYSF